MSASGNPTIPRAMWHGSDLTRAAASKGRSQSETALVETRSSVQDELESLRQLLYSKDAELQTATGTHLRMIVLGSY
jgi:hypothetical protein